MNPYKFILSTIHKNMLKDRNYFVDFNSSRRSVSALNILRMVKENVFNESFNNAYGHILIEEPNIHNISIDSERSEALQKSFYQFFLEDIRKRNSQEIFKINLEGMSDFYFVNDKIVEVTIDSGHLLKEMLIDLIDTDAHGDMPEYLEFVFEDLFMKIRREYRKSEISSG